MCTPKIYKIYNKIQRTKQDDGNDGDSSVGEQGAAVEQVGEARCDRSKVENRVDESGKEEGALICQSSKKISFKNSKGR